VYLVVDDESQEAVVVDTALGSSFLLKEAEELHAQIKYILNTHGHPDHISDNIILKKATAAKLAIHELDAYRLSRTMLDASFFPRNPPLPVEADLLLHEGDAIHIGKVSLQVLHTPGHTEGSICLYEAYEGTLFTGDTLFAGSFGRVDLPGGSCEGMMKTLRRLSQLPPNTKVFPGHGPPTTIEDEVWLTDPDYIRWLFS